jgi:hypothetical protein
MRARANGLGAERAASEGVRMDRPGEVDGFDERDVGLAIESLQRAAFRSRYVRTDCQSSDPDWTTEDGQRIDEHVRQYVDQLKGDVDALDVRDFSGYAFHRLTGNVQMVVDGHHLGDVVAPSPADLLHIYGPDRDNTGDWTKYYRYAWRDKGPHAIVFASDDEVIRQGRLSCNSYAYSGQSSYALQGAGLFFRPQSDNEIVSIRPYVQWSTSASFTGVSGIDATARAMLGIYVESWTGVAGEGYYTDWDHWITVFAQDTQSYTTGVNVGGTATVGDGLSFEMLAVGRRRYHIFVYAYLDTTAGPSRGNDHRFVTIDVEAKVPYVVIEERPF